MNLQTPIKRNGHTCNCYVKSLPAIDQYELHYGAHETCCPVYRVSLDPVDRKHDEEIRSALCKK